MLNTIWLIITALAFGGVVEKAGVLERLITPIIEKAKSNGALVASLVSSIFATNVITGRPVHRDRAAGQDVQDGLRAARPGPRRAVPLRRGFGHAHVRADPVEQLRRLHGRDAGRRHVELCAVGVLQLREPAADDWHRLCGNPDAARARAHRRPAVAEPAIVRSAIEPCRPVAVLRRSSASKKMRHNPLRSFAVLRKPAFVRPAPMPRAIVLAALATLTLLSACQRAEEKPAPEIRPVRAITIEKRAAGDTVALTGTRPGADRDQPVVPDRRPDARAAGEHRRHRAAGAARRAARLAERGEQPAGSACAARGGARPADRGAQQLRAVPRPGRGERGVARVVRAGRVHAEDRRIAGRIGADAGDAGGKPALATRGWSPTWPASSRRVGAEPGEVVGARPHDRAGRARRRRATPCSTCPRASRMRHRRMPRSPSR